MKNALYLTIAITALSAGMGYANGNPVGPCASNPTHPMCTGGGGGGTSTNPTNTNTSSSTSTSSSGSNSVSNATGGSGGAGGNGGQGGAGGTGYGGSGVGIGQGGNASGGNSTSSSTATGGSATATGGQGGASNSLSTSSSGGNTISGGNSTTTVDASQRTTIKHAASTAAGIAMPGYGVQNCFGDTNPSGSFGASIQTFGWGVTANSQKASNVCALVQLMGPRAAVAYLAQMDPNIGKALVNNGLAVSVDQVRAAKAKAPVASHPAPPAGTSCPATHPVFVPGKGCRK